MEKALAVITFPFIFEVFVNQFFKIVFSSILVFAPFISVFSNCVDDETGWLNEYVATYPDFPIPGVAFKFYSKLLKEPAAFKRAMRLMADRYRDVSIDAVIALDSRGFIFGTALAYELDLPLVLVRKRGKLPGDVISISYELEYGKSTFEIEKNILQPNQKVLIVDDIIATGGTVNAAGKLVESLGAEVVSVACLLELCQLDGRSRIRYPIYALMEVH